MGNEIEKIPILRLTEGGSSNIEDVVAREFPLTIILNNQELVTLLCIDKIFGGCLLKDIPTYERVVITSGRISSEILLKVAKRNIPVTISKSAPTDLGVKLANDLGITLLDFVRGKRINVYANDWRVARDGK